MQHEENGPVTLLPANEFKARVEAAQAKMLEIWKRQINDALNKSQTGRVELALSPDLSEATRKLLRQCIIDAGYAVYAAGSEITITAP